MIDDPIGGEGRVYRLPPRPAGTLVYGLPAGQLALGACGVLALIIAVSTIGGAAGLTVGLLAGAGFAALAVVPIRGVPIYLVLPGAARFARRELAGANRATLPLLAPPGERRPSPSLTGLVLRGLPGPADDAAATARGPSKGMRPAVDVGWFEDPRGGTAAAVLAVTGGPFALAEPDAQDAALAGWERVLAQFARETPPVQLGWTVRTAPSTPELHLAWAGAGYQAPLGGSGYERLVRAAAAGQVSHDVYVTISQRTRLLRLRRIDAAAAIAAAAHVLGERLSTAGFTVDVLPAEDLADLARHWADPHTAEISDPTGIDGRDAHACWDALRIGESWHRTLWIPHWPTGELRPGWLDPLLRESAVTRTLTVWMTPDAARKSQRRLNSDTVAVDTQLQLRSKHGLRVSTQLADAHSHIQRRDADLAAGHPELAYTGVLDVTAPSRAALDEACHTMADLAARTGLAPLRPALGRADLAWPATLPGGRIPTRPRTGGL